MADTPDISKLTNEELMAELARRMSGSAGTMTTMERMGEALASDLKRRTLRAHFDVLEAEEKRTVSSACPKCGRATPVKARARPRKLVTMAGTQELRRNYHFCGLCKHGFYPLDERLQLPADGELSSEVERRILDFGINDTFQDAAERFTMHYGLEISENLVRRVVERVGRQLEEHDRESLQERLRPRSSEPAELLVVGMDGSMLPMRGGDAWREAKVGVVYRAEAVERGGSGRGRVGSARYAAVLGPPCELAKELASCLAVEQCERASQAVVIGDGAPWIWRLAEELLPEAHQVLDWAHVAEHIAACSAALLDDDAPSRQLWRHRAEHLVWQGQVGELLRELHECISVGRLSATKTTALQDLIRYLVTHEERLNYSVFRDAGFPVGSGFVESAHRHVLQTRMKRAGQRWDPEHAKRMAGLRAALRTSGPASLHSAIRIHGMELAA